MAQARTGPNQQGQGSGALRLRGRVTHLPSGFSLNAPICTGEDGSCLPFIFHSEIFGGNCLRRPLGGQGRRGDPGKFLERVTGKLHTAPPLLLAPLLLAVGIVIKT